MGSPRSGDQSFQLSHYGIRSVAFDIRSVVCLIFDQLFSQLFNQLLVSFHIRSVIQSVIGFIQSVVHVTFSISCV